MAALILQKNKLLLAGVLAFLFLLGSQISVQAYDFLGGWSPVRTVGDGVGYWLTVGQTGVDSDVNIGEMPSVTTGVATQFGTQATLNGNISNMGVASSVYRYFEWGYDLTYPNSTAQGTSIATGAFSDAITFDTLKVVHYRAVTQVGAVKVYGADATVEAGDVAQGGNLLNQILPVIVAAAIIISIVVVGLKGAGDLFFIEAVAFGLIAYAITSLLLKAFFG